LLIASLNDRFDEEGQSIYRNRLPFSLARMPGNFWPVAPAVFPTTPETEKHGLLKRAAIVKAGHYFRPSLV
jgi:hypothetical protein